MNLTLGDPKRNHDALPSDALTMNYPVLLDGEQIGVVGFQQYATGELYFHGGFPEMDDRGHGYGTAAFHLLMAEVRRLGLADGAGEIRLLIRPDNVAALALARKFGFVEDHLVMRYVGAADGR